MEVGKEGDYIPIFVVRSNDSFNFPLGLIKSIVLVITTLLPPE